MTDPFSQEAYRVRLEWGRAGVRRAAGRGDIIVVVDVLRFTTAVATAMHHGVAIYPCAWEDDPAQYAQSIGAHVGKHLSRYSLSPSNYFDAPPDTRVVLRSLNGATCAQYARQIPYLFAGALVNAKAVGSAVASLLSQTNLAATVIACGERWPQANEDGELRFAIEDYLGAGAILSHLSSELSPEAALCRKAFASLLPDELPRILRDCGSGKELIQTDRVADVEHAGKLDLYSGVPVLREGRFVDFAPLRT